LEVAVVLAVDAPAARAAQLVPLLAARAAEHDRDASFPFEAIALFRDAGLLTLTVPREAGGGGEGLASVCAVLEEIGRGDAAAGLVLTMQLTWFAFINRSGTWPSALVERLNREAVTEGATINAVRAEPELGTPSRGGLPATIVERTADGWRVNGHKLYATGSPVLRYFAVWARTAGEQPRVGYIVVPRDAPGVRIVETWNHIGMRASGSHDVIFENVSIPDEFVADMRSPAEWGAFDPLTALWVSLPLAALYTGIARAARDWLVAYLNERTPANLGAPLATLPRFQIAVGEIETLLHVNHALIAQLIAEVEVGDTKSAERASLVKSVATNNTIRAVDIALGLVGNPGLSRHHPLERYHRDALCGRVHTPQDDSVMQALGRAALGA
jgi:alkylation response protein AidB-like acyl-CoA dehydrogenase